MEKKNILDGDITDLKIMRKDIKELNDMERYKEDLSFEIRNLEKNIETDHQILENTIAQTVKSRREEIEKAYNTEIEKLVGKDRKIKGQREKAKEKGVIDRIAEETKPVYEENAKIREEIANIMKKNNIPSFCNSSLYFSMFFASSIKEMLLFIILLIGVFLFLPCGIYLLIPNHRAYYLVIIYFVIIVVAFLSYILINDRTKVAHTEELKTISRKRKLIAQNNRKIKVMRNNIKKDRNEEYYNLNKFDAKLSDNQKEMDLYKKKKISALATFEEETVPVLRKQHEDEDLPRINRMEEELNRKKKQKEDIKQKVKERTLYVSTNYESYLGKEMCTVERIDRLMQIMSQNENMTISAALKAGREPVNLQK